MFVKSALKLLDHDYPLHPKNILRFCDMEPECGLAEGGSAAASADDRLGDIV